MLEQYNPIQTKSEYPPGFHDAGDSNQEYDNQSYLSIG